MDDGRQAEASETLLDVELLLDESVNDSPDRCVTELKTGRAEAPPESRRCSSGFGMSTCGMLARSADSMPRRSTATV